MTEQPDDQPRPLDASELDRALTELAHWHGDSGGIGREVALNDTQRAVVLHRVEAVQEELDRTALIDRRDDAVAFVVFTPSVGAVTELDLQLARRIDEAIGAVAGEG